MSVIGVISTFNEGGRIAGAVKSLLHAGCDRVFVLDGAWIAPDGRPFGGGERFSTDDTVVEALTAGAMVETECFGDDAATQTALVQRCGAKPGDFVVRIDADEVFSGFLPDLTGNALVWLLNHGANDLPGVRSTWPRGDNADHPIPLMRVLEWRSDLVCVRPGRWVTADGPIEPYRVGAMRHQIDSRGLAYDHRLSLEYRTLRDNEHLLAPADTAAIPILDGVWIDHYRDGLKAEAKRAYYEAVA